MGKEEDRKSHIAGVGNFPKLDEWLSKHRARCMWSARPAPDKKLDPVVQCWLLNGHIVVVVMHPRNPHTGSTGGWAVFTEAGRYTLNIEETLAEAEKNLGVGQ